jgi:hypothetical protein
MSPEALIRLAPFRHPDGSQDVPDEREHLAFLCNLDSSIQAGRIFQQRVMILRDAKFHRRK